MLVGISDDGMIAAANRFSDGNDLACIWTPATSVIGLAAYLDIVGVQYDHNWVFAEVTGISADGKTISGWGVLNGIGYGYVITVPTPAPLIALGFSLMMYRRPSRS